MNNSEILQLQIGRLEDLRVKLNDISLQLTNESILMISTELQPLYKKLIMSDLDGAVSRQMDNFMWNDCFKTPLTRFGRGDKSLFHIMIECGVGFYLGLIHDIGINFDVPFINRNAVRSLYCTTPGLNNGMNAPSKNSLYYVIQNSLVHVGDLLRYRGAFPEALKMYDKSSAVSPSNGQPYNQMGLVQMLIDNKGVDSVLGSIYYYARAVSVLNPFHPAHQNLESLFNRLNQLKPCSSVEEVIVMFLKAVGGVDFNLNSASLMTLLSPLLSMGSVSSTQLFRLIVIGLWAWKRESDKNLIGMGQTNESYILELLAAIMNAILIAAIGFPDLHSFYALSHLKIFMDWLRVNGFILSNTAFRSKICVGALCTLLNGVVGQENALLASLQSNELEFMILPEEKKLLGFIPVCRNYETLQVLLEESDEKVIPIRVCRLLKAAETLSHSRLSFIERGGNGLYGEIPFMSQVPRLFRAPSRRNVALQSIISNLLSPTEGSLPFDSPDTFSNFSDHEGSSCWNDFHMGAEGTSSPSAGGSEISEDAGDSIMLATPPDLSSATSLDIELDSESTHFSSLFHSIWTPLQPDSDDGGDGWKN